MTDTQDNLKASMMADNASDASQFGLDVASVAFSSAEARHISPWTTNEKMRRVLWGAVQGTLFRFSFHTWYGWRNWLLRAFGGNVHRTARMRRTVRIEIPWNITLGEQSSVGDRAILYALGPITVGNRVSISQNAHLCAGTHDFNRADMPLIRPPITIHDDAWIAADAFVGPGVTVGEGAILGARACAFKNLDPWTIYGGNPARALRSRPKLSEAQ